MPTPKPKPSNADSVARKKAIVERRSNGDSVGDISKDLGVSRAYVYYILKEHKERGNTAIERQGRGKPKDQPLSFEESQALLKTLKGTQPWQHGINSGMWSEAEVKEWFLRKFKRTIAVGQIRKIVVEHNIRMRPLSALEWKEIPRIPTVQELKNAPEPENEQALNCSEWTDGHDMDFDAIKASVAETRKSLAKRQLDYLDPRPGIRTGKHRKQKAPQRKKKKRKR